ncbi:malonate decarboxylase acyl carrier protein [Ligilactobacillus sp. WILCCON 0076]|uniref:Malonate decarboxylase acyl carrier protein n=1 Tax=Ligilactobacillus ubinensis TaxID=2876789 RepID=A0A9X2JMC8_9LACO|nr:malonate decarboxylase acyl carrier protein [Ligilactobacillus ubinensis]MCP0887774.1 malonate decarboxylase acyl carrier protein [Ligilactobacillus ubinensis]
MEKLYFKFTTTQPVTKFVHVGVVASGDLEIILRPNNHSYSTLNIITGSDGFKSTWSNVLSRFFDRYPLQGDFEINDFGATPGVVNLRLSQVMEVLKNEQ